MKKFQLSSVAIALALTLTACGGSSSNEEPTPTTPSSLSFGGTAVKGTLIGALVEVFAASDLEQTNPLGTAQTDENGDYSIEITDDSGEPIQGAFVVRITAGDDTTMICDAILCEGGAQGEAIPVANLELSTITYSNDTGVVDADVNVLTTLATETIIAAATDEETVIDFGAITVEGLAVMQEDASEIIGAVLGIDLSETNIYDVEIVDASNSADVSTDNAIAATLTVVNASFSSLTVDTDAGESLGDIIVNYVAAVTEVTTALLEDPTIDVGVVASEALVLIESAQSQIAEEVFDIATEIAQDTGIKVPVTEVPTVVEVDELTEIIGDVVAGTGAIGG